MGALPGDAVSVPVCFQFSAIQDDIGDSAENISVVLQSTNNIVTSGTGAINVGNHEVTITILESTTPVEPGSIFEGICCTSTSTYTAFILQCFCNDNHSAYSCMP